jgi:hypothetical protein
VESLSKGIVEKSIELLAEKQKYFFDNQKKTRWTLQGKPESYTTTVMALLLN